MSELNGGQVPPPQYPQAPQQPKKKMSPVLKFVIAIVVIGALGLVSCVAIVGTAVDQADKELDGTNVTATNEPSSKATKTALPKKSAEVKDYEYSGLKVTRSTDSLNMFAGVITIKNNTDDVKDYYVEVTIFKGSQDIGSLMGTIKVKANSAGQLKLTSLDDYVKGATDYQVQITPGL